MWSLKEKMGYLWCRRSRFYLQASQSPTYNNLCRYLSERGWRRARFSWQADFGEHNFQFDTAAAECLEYKHLLAQLVSSYCPELMPLTYCINDTNWPDVLNRIAQKAQNQSFIWILKPALLNNGQHIKIFQNVHQLEQHYSNNNRLGGEHVVQQYLLRPYLLQGPKLGHKFTIRMFVVLTNYAGVYLYPKGYFNVGLNPYQTDDFSDLRSHLTNEHLNENERNVVQIITDQYDLFKPFYPKIKNIVTSTVQALQQVHPNAFIKEKQPALALFGFDFLVDHESRVWLLEANHAPCFPISDEHPLQNSLYRDFWQALITSFIIPIATRSPENCINYQLFDRIGD